MGIYWLAILVALTGCHKKSRIKETSRPAKIDILHDLYIQNEEYALKVRDPVTGWLARQDCDGMIWAGRYASVADGVDIEAAQYEPGKFGRRPPPWCWTPENGDQGSRTEWSRDMAIGGLLPFIWNRSRRDLLEAHITYGEDHKWQMGEPLADGRTLYTPNLIGLLYKMSQALGGAFRAGSLWPSVYPAGLIDFEAHLQVMTIWLQGEVAARLSEGDAVPKRPDGPVMLSDDGEWLVARDGGLAFLEISETMYQRLEEHAKREPRCALYQAVYGLYSGDLEAATDILVFGPNQCSYLRCGADSQCALADWMFTAALVLRQAR